MNPGRAAQRSRGRVHPRVGAERPSHRLLHEELIVPETRFQAVVEERRIGVLLAAKLAQQGRPPPPDVLVARPGAHQGAHRLRLRDEDVPKAGRSDPVDVVPPSPIDDELVEHGDRVHRHPAQKGSVHGELDRRMALLAIPRFPPQGENRGPPDFGGGRRKPVEDGPRGPSHDRRPHTQERQRRLHVALLPGRTLGLAHRPECVVHGGKELARNASSRRFGRHRRRHVMGNPGMERSERGAFLMRFISRLIQPPLVSPCAASGGGRAIVVNHPVNRGGRRPSRTCPPRHAPTRARRR